MKNIIYHIVFMYALLFQLSCHTNNAKTSEQNPQQKLPDDEIKLTEAQFHHTKIKTGPITEKPIATVLQLNGKIDVPPQNMVSISAPVGGYLRATSLLPGMHINKGQIIAQIEDQQIIQMQQDYLHAQVRVKLLQQDYDRQHALYAAQANSEKVLQQAKSALDDERVNLQALSQKLQLIGISPASVHTQHIVRSIAIHSPIDGFVSRVNVNIGKYVSPSEILFDLVNPSDIHLNLQVFEKDVANLAIGQTVWAYAPANPDKKYHCQIILISKDVNQNKTIDVHCHFSEYEPHLIPGMYLSAQVETTIHLSNAVPEDAVVTFDNQTYIFQEIANRHYKMLPISVGLKENGYVQVALAPGVVANNNKPYVLQDAYTLLMEMKNTAE